MDLSHLSRKVRGEGGAPAKVDAREVSACLSGAYFRSLARSHNVAKNGSATSSTSTPAGKPT